MLGGLVGLCDADWFGPFARELRKFSGPEIAAIVFAQCDGLDLPKQGAKFISRSLLTISSAIGGFKPRERF